jgi:hypothetical protein
MTTALKIIKAGFRKATINSGYKPLNATETADALEILNDLIIEWNTSGALIGIDPVISLDTDLSEPRYATKALKLMIGGEICVEFGKPITPGFAAIASSAYNKMLAASQPLERPVYPDNVPYGEGNQDFYQDDYYDNTFFPQNLIPNF